ncbi:hypothetical protein ACP4OV_027061 [Aristida adscensionis]
MPSRRHRLARRRRRRRRRDAAAARDWADGLPTDVLLAILHRLDQLDVLMAADRVCRSWRRAARDEPSLWRRVVLRGGEGQVAARLNRRGMACEAVSRGAGRCEAFCGEYAGDDGFLIYLSERAPFLKSLRLITCDGVTDDGLIEAVKEFPLLEELELSLCENVTGLACEVVGELFANDLTNDGLVTILDNCSQLKSLDIRHCFNIKMDETLLLKFARTKTLRLPHDPTDDYDLPIGRSPARLSSDRYYASPGYISYSCSSSGEPSPCDSPKDSDEDSDFYGEPSRYETDLDRYDKMLPFGMRTFLK